MAPESSTATTNIRIDTPEDECGKGHRSKDAKGDPGLYDPTDAEVRKASQERKGADLAGAAAKVGKQHLGITVSMGSHDVLNCCTLHESFLDGAKGRRAGHGVHNSLRSAPGCHVCGERNQQEHTPNKSGIPDVLADAAERKLCYAYGNNGSYNHNPKRRCVRKVKRQEHTGYHCGEVSNCRRLLEHVLGNCPLQKHA